MTVRTTLTDVDTGPVKSRYACLDCGQLVDMFRLRDEIWRAAFPEEEEQKLKIENANAFLKWAAKFRAEWNAEPDIHSATEARNRLFRSPVLCFNCTERRLGRQLRIDDFTDHNINRPIFMGFNIAMGVSDGDAEEAHRR